jgi:iron complex transport system ATP-binding protein
LEHEKIVEFHGIALTLDGKRVIQDLTWLVRSDQHWALMGPNGSGKTTLLRLVNGYIWPTMGTASVLGRRFGEYDLRELRKSIGFASSFMSEQVPAGLNALEVVLSGRFASIGLHNLPSSREVNRARSLLRKVGCLQLASKPYHALSQGEKQRVIIARALMNSPKLLTLDESCDGLDLDAREILLAFLESIGRMRGSPTLIFATHRVEEITPIFTHVLIMKGGRIVASGPKRNVLTGKNLSKAYTRDVSIVRRNGRYHTIVS